MKINNENQMKSIRKINNENQIKTTLALKHAFWARAPGRILQRFCGGRRHRGSWGAGKIRPGALAQKAYLGVKVVLIDFRYIDFHH